ncbi:MAG: glycosyltransferase family 4 protein [Candidatus Andersenbacteria bacterium]
MRIVHTTLRYPPASGGAETYVRDIVERTRDIEAGRDVRVLTSKMRTHGPISELDPGLLLDDPPYVQRLHHASTPGISYPRLQALRYYLGHHKPDIIHGYGFWYQPADTAARYALQHHIPFIFHPIYYENEIRQKAVWQLYKRTIGRKTFATADVVVVISPYEQQLIEQAGFLVNRFELIPPGIDVSRFETQRISPFLKRDIFGRIMLSVSRIAESKGIQDIIAILPDAIRAIPDLQYVIVGEDFGYMETLKQQAKSSGVADRVHFLGKVDESELIGAYQHADIFVHPSHYEAFGIVVAEALAAGTPVVARNVSAIPFVAPHREAGLLCSTNEEFTQAIISLISDQKMSQQYGVFGKAHVTEEFSWDVVIKKVVALYHSLLPELFE